MIMGDHRKRDKPHWLDYSLALAFETVESEKCNKCGVPAWYAYSENRAIAFEMDHIDCESCAFEEQNNSSKERKKPGRTKYVKAVAEDGFELPTRADFQQEMMAKAEKAAAKKEKK